MSCPDCFKGAIHDHAEPTGRFETLFGVRTYITGDANAKSAIIYLPDAFGLKLVNNKLLADRYAAGTGCKVLSPDLLYNGGLNPSHMEVVEKFVTPGVSFFTKLWSFFVLAPDVIPFMVWGRPSTAYPEVVKYARALRADLPPGGKLGVAGFCWGGHGSTSLCTEKATKGGSEPLIDAQFNGHPSQLKTPDMVLDAIAAKVPYSCAVAQLDTNFSEKVSDEVEAAVRAKIGPPEENHYEFVIHKDCLHGFCVRAKPDTPNMDGYHAAAKQAIDWFNRYLK